MAPSAAAAALAALGILEAEPERIAKLNRNAKLFLGLLRAGGARHRRLGRRGDRAAVLTGSSIRAGRLAAALFARGVNAPPILFPAVPERAARLRFFVSAGHSEAQLQETARLVIEEHRAVAAEPVDLAGVVRHLGG